MSGQLSLALCKVISILGHLDCKISRISYLVVGIINRRGFPSSFKLPGLSTGVVEMQLRQNKDLTMAIIHLLRGIQNHTRMHFASHRKECYEGLLLILKKLMLEQIEAGHVDISTMKEWKSAVEDYCRPRDMEHPDFDEDVFYFDKEDSDISDDLKELLNILELRYASFQDRVTTKYLTLLKG